MFICIIYFYFNVICIHVILYILALMEPSKGLLLTTCHCKAVEGVCHATNYQLHSKQLVALQIRQCVKCLIIKLSIQVVTMVTNHS